MHDKRGSHKNQGLNDFETAFVHDTRHWIRQLTIEADVDTVAIGGRVNSFYAVQLAIEAVKAFCERRTPFAVTRLSLVVAGYPVEFKFMQQHSAQVDKSPSLPMRARRSELTAV